MYVKGTILMINKFFKVKIISTEAKPVFLEIFQNTIN